MKRFQYYGLWRYRLATVALLPAVLFYTVYRASKDGGLTYLRQRLGFKLPATEAPIWIHCASVGEVNTAASVIEKFSQNGSGTPVLVSTTTPTGRAVFLNKQLPNTLHLYLPLDYRPIIKKVLVSIRPKTLLIMETELWPELLDCCNKASIPVILFNARLTDRTLGTFGWLLKTYARCLQSLRAVLTKSELDRERFLQLGMSPERAEVVGSLKFASHHTSLPMPIPDINRTYWLAASTHDDEEFRICQAWLQAGRDELLLIAPRHPERRATIVRQLKALTPHIQLRSQNKQLQAETRIYIADTLGEMPGFIAGARVVFMGGSLITRGGHNLIEAAQLGAAVITGPHMKNFIGECSVLKNNHAVLQVKNENELIRAVCELLDDDAKRHKLSRNALRVCEEKSRISDIYYEKLLALSKSD